MNNLQHCLFTLCLKFNCVCGREGGGGGEKMQVCGKHVEVSFWELVLNFYLIEAGAYFFHCTACFIS